MLAKNRALAEATQLAGQFMNLSASSLQKVQAISNSTLTFSYASMNPKSTNSGSEAFYYVFDKGNDNGYVIVSGDDRTKSILGYTDEGHFDISVLPVNIKYWLNFYENEIKALPDTELQTAEVSTTTISNVKSKSATNSTAVAPLLGSVKWNQSSPFNDQCPIINTSTGAKAVTGCVATGMAQVMKYYNWPIQGTGSNTYTTNSLGIALTVDFSTTQYDWNNMTQAYSSSSTATQNTAVATLMYHCGVAVNMDYGESSSASTTKMASALKNNFGYDSNLQLYSRDYYTRAEWVNLLSTELNSSRPVLFAGDSDGGGHLFVCDGYDSNGLFHFNWGWGGVSNGYFQISALDTDSPGISSSTIGYNNGQNILVGLQKPSTTSTPTYLLYAKLPPTCTSTSVARTESITITGNKIYNLGVNTFSGSVGIALYNDNGLVQVVKSTTLSSLSAGYGYTALALSSSIPTGIANGNYKMYFVYKATAEANWQILRGKVGTPNYMNIVVGATSVAISAPAASAAVLNLNSISLPGNLYQNKTGRFNVNITNSGSEYNSKIGINLQSITDNSIYQLITPELINIAAGETRTLNFTGNITMNPGQYSVSVVYDQANNYSSTSTVFSQLGTALTSNVLTAPTATPTLTLSTIISFPNSASVEKGNVVLTAKIKNSTGLFDSKLIAYIFPKAAGTASVAYLGYQSAIIDTNEEKTVIFSGSLDLTPAEYQIRVYYLNSSSQWSPILPTTYYSIPFTLVENKTSVISPNSVGFEIYPNPVENTLQLKTDLSINRIVITDLLGKQVKSVIPTSNSIISMPVNDLKSGTYLIQILTDNEIKTSKFIKK